MKQKENREYKFLIDKAVALCLRQHRRSLCRAGGTVRENFAIRMDYRFFDVVIFFSLNRCFLCIVCVIW